MFLCDMPESQRRDNGFVSSRELSSRLIKSSLSLLTEFPSASFTMLSSRHPHRFTSSFPLLRTHSSHHVYHKASRLLMQAQTQHNGTVPCQTEKNGAISYNKSTYDYTIRDKLCPRCQKLEDKRQEKEDKSCGRHRRKTPRRRSRSGPSRVSLA